MSVAEKIAQQQAVREKQQAENQARRNTEKQRQIDNTQQEIESYQKQQAEIERQIKEQESEIARFELEEQKRQLTQKQKDSLVSSYQIQIQELEQKKSDAASSFFSSGGQGGANFQTGNQRIAQREFNQKIDSQIRKLESNRELALNIMEYQSEYPGRTLNSQLLKEFRGGSSTGSLVNLQRQKDEILRGQEETARMDAQVQARSDIAKESEKLDKIKHDFEQSKKEKDSMFGAETAKFQNYDLKVSIKTGLGKQLADSFKDLPDVDPKSIYGTTEAKSKQAVYTFEETERQQAELSKLLRGSSSVKEAYEIKTGFQEKNPYVGTANIQKYKGKTVDTQGVTIEKELNTAIPNFEDLPGQPQKTTQKDYLVELEESLSFDFGLEGGTNREQSRPEIVFINEKGDEIKNPDISTLWQYTKDSLSFAAFDPTPSKTELALNKYEKENLGTIAAFEKTDLAKESGKLDLVYDREKDPFAKGFLGHSDEIADLVRGKETKEPAVESLAMTDLSNFAKSNLGLEPARESETLKAITKKAKTPEGQLWIAGSLAGTAAITAATIIVPGLLSVRLGTLAAKKTLKEATEIALKTSSKAPDEAFISMRTKEITKDLKAKFPTITETELKKITERILTKEKPNVSELQKRTEFAKDLKKMAPSITEKERANVMAKVFGDDPYTIDLINPKTALIVTGTESTQGKVILYQRGGLSRIYEAPSDRVLTLKNILLKGRQSDKKAIEASLKEQFPSITPEESKKWISALTKDLEKGKILLTTKQARLAQKESPLIRETKERITIGSKLYRVVRGTDAINYEKMDLGRYRATKKNLATLADESEYAFIGTEKAIKSKDLKSLPKTMLESLETEEPYKAAGIYERAPPDKKPKKSGKAASYSSDLGKIEITTGKDKNKSGKQRIEIKSDSEKIEIKTGSGKMETLTEKKPPTTDLETLKKIAREQAGPQAKSISQEASALANSFKTSAKTNVKSNTSNRTAMGTESKQLGAQMNRIALQTGQALDEFKITKPGFKTGLEDLNLIKTAERITIRTNQKQDTAGLYSLITSKGLKEDIAQQLKTKIKITQKLKTDIETPTPTRTRTTTTRPRKPKPYTTISAEMKNQLKILRGKKSKMFFRWNVNELSPGFYLPTKELTTGRTAKAVRKVERLQTKISKQKIKFKLK